MGTLFRTPLRSTFLSMRSIPKTKQGRLQIRIDPTSKVRIEKAARYTRKSVSDFVIDTTVAEAERIIDEYEHATLSDVDWNIFYEALVDPPKPNKLLKAAWRRHVG